MPAFHLLPFTGGATGRVCVSGSVERRGTSLRVCYRLTGDLSGVLIPPAAPAPRRRDRLWESTCFELFAAGKEGESYLEVNLSPSGEWNVYSFTGYRAGMRPSAQASLIPFPGTREVGRLELGFDLSCGADLDGALRIGVSAILASPTGEITCFALRHPGERPDFHHPGGFVIELDA